MSAIIRSRVTQYRLIIEDEVQAGGQALTHGLNSRPRQPGWLSYFCLFFPPPLSPPRPLPILRLRSTLIIGDANASLLFQSLSLTARHWRETRRGRLFSIRVNRSRTVSPADRFFLSRHVSTLFVTSTLTQQCNQYFWLVPILFDGKFFFHPKMRRIEFVLRDRNRTSIFSIFFVFEYRKSK